ncbi:tetraacyldisaccharide 4'-kinase [Campylobacter vulpis]|uniref:tetraacyldisaccharide 4'-kinase n=1 Tax=Campylobacter vulpis TaxID=1655500 RepID=UPI000C161566|nr:tetraacyldisaccharide 4'-kinase [Campylobacter vulpis]MBS4275029.1 tetraacyldisaccharide 4'-kinase [Campylobacter vulpis]MBS4306130.1 tetraacyldisaccharide 4'-kinase [Campylobacter vulpis]MBS4422752.1 tetraacyldisaccharide 4'-kinase [Campylobacter vulpis]PHY92234.1 tetraacyldisaccharide 4'-kinase [Campylobacter vulpis]QNF78191.1 tetraacyldisaccharide 4'-kinase [Campylobacter vulpis]
MSWLERYFFNPSFFQKCLAFALLPLSFLYALIAILNTKFRSQVDFKKPIISVGNLSFGGNGKTPLCKAISREFEGVFIVLRGYKRKSKGLILVKHQNNILCEVAQSGDEAMEYAFCESIEGVIVSEDRIKGIKKALRLGAKVILLDDAFSKFHIKKFDILVEGKPLPYFDFTLPSGAYRLPPYFKKKANFIAKEGEEFYRYSFVKENVKAILVTAIAKPYRLNEHFDKARACYFFSDHHHFTKEELENLLKKHHCHTLMLTFKDYVKIKDFGFKCEIIELNVELSENFKEQLKAYVRSFDAIG